MNIGKIITHKQGERESITGTISTMQVHIPHFWLDKNLQKSGTHHPDYRIMVAGPDNNPVQIGSAWIKETRDLKKFLSITIDDPSFQSTLNVAAFRQEDSSDSYDIVWRRRQSVA